MSELPPAPSPRPRRTRWVLLGVVAALWAGAVGAVIVATRRDDAEAAGSFTPSTHADLTQLQYVIGDLPEGFRQLDAVGADEAVAPTPPDDAVWMGWSYYGTSDDPSAPHIMVTAGDEALAPDFEHLGQTSGVVESKVDGRRAACGNWVMAAEADAGPEQVWCYIDAEPQMVWVQTERIGLEATVAMLQGLQFDGDLPRLDPTVLPADVALLSADTADAAPVYATAVAQYQGPCGPRLRLEIAWDDEQELAMTSLASSEWSVVEIGDATGYFTDGASATQQLVWEADGRSFTLSAITAGEVDLVALARSVRMASAEEWAARNNAVPVSSDC